MIPVYEEKSNKLVRPTGTVVRIDVYSHHVKLSQYGRSVKEVLISFCRNFSHYGLLKKGRKWVRGITKVFVATTRDREEFNFHINSYEDLIRHFGKHGYAPHQLWIVEHKLYTPTKIKLRYHDKRIPRDYQREIYNYILSKGKTKVVTLRTGEGKTFITLMAINGLSQRVFFCIKPMYIKKWISDIKEAFDIKAGDIMTISGSDQLKSLIAIALNKELKAKFILCSNSTFFMFLKNYEIFGNELLDVGYGCTPHDLYKVLDVGLRVIDEVHQDFHLNFRQDLYSHVPKTLSLSGTLDSNDKFIVRMHETMFPMDIRFQTVGSGEIYTAMDALMYYFPNAERRIRFSHGRMGAYSHISFELSVLSRPKILEKYVDMICNIVQNRFVDIYEKGQKMVIYCSTIKLCTVVTAALKERHRKMKVYRYTGEDDYHEMLNSEIIVSTIKSLGTAIDIDGLRIVLLTDALDSLQANLQAAGRLRKMKNWPDTTPEFLYVVCSDIPKHLDYHERKKEMFRNKVVGQRITMTGYSI